MSSMDIDAALNELGMLSSVTESRRQFLQERKLTSSAVSPSTPIRLPRDRQLSEPGAMPATPTNSPQRGTYRILHINPQYVASVTTLQASGCNADTPGPANSGFLDSNRLTVAQEGFSLPVPPFGAKYSQDMLERDSQTSRLARVKLARLKRFKRPYEVPWRHSTEVCYSSYSTSPGTSNDSHLAASVAVVTTPDRLTRGGSDHKLSNSNASTPEKLSAQRKQSMQRSRSLDELDFAKIQLAEAENHNIVLQKREIDNMSHHLRNLQVTE